MRQFSSYHPGQRLDIFRRQSGIGLERGRYDVLGVDSKTKQVEVERDGKTTRFDPSRLPPGSHGLALSVPTDIEIRPGDRLIWTTNNRQLGITNGTQVDVVKIDRGAITLRDATAERTLASDNPLRENLAHGLVLNMHRAQGLTVDRAITVMDSHDRQLNSTSLFYVLASRAREHIGIHVDNKAELAAAIGKHNGEPLNARDLFPELRGHGEARREAGIAEAGAKADATTPEPKPAETERDTPQIPFPEKYLDMGM